VFIGISYSAGPYSSHSLQTYHTANIIPVINKQTETRFLILHWQIENFFDSANHGGIASVLHEVVADLHAGCAIHGGDLNDHVQRFTLSLSTTRMRAEVVRQICPDTECCLETNFVALLFQTEGFVLV